jgi:hypothetical protein
VVVSTSEFSTKSAQEASKKAAVQDALKAINAPAVAVEAPKS